VVLTGLLLAGGSTGVDAQAPGSHPEYLHAIRNLREARGLLQFPFTKPEHIQAASAALSEIRDAIGDLKFASHIDEKNLADVPPDKTMPPEGRFHKINDLLSSAYKDTKQPESDTVARPYKDRALDHIYNAQKAIQPALVAGG
jgi:L-lysine 2,3-aminomutase